MSNRDFVSLAMRFSAAFLVIFFGLLGSANAVTRYGCGEAGYVIGYFNGIANSPGDAYSSAFLLLRLMDQTPNQPQSTYMGQPLEAIPFLNQSEGVIEDIIETFKQRAREIDPSGTIERDLGAFLHALLRGNSQRWEGSPQLIDARNRIYADLADRIVAALQRYTTSELIEADYREHNARLQELVNHGKKLTLVAHSQGNLFVNHAYEYLRGLLKERLSEMVGVVHVAPASTTRNGEYMLSENDFVITRLLALVGATFEPTIPLPRNEGGLFRWLGHSFQDTYYRHAKHELKAMMDRAMARLGMGSAFQLEQRQLFWVEATWDVPAPPPILVNLLITEPNGYQVGRGDPPAFVHGMTGIAGLITQTSEVYHAFCDGGWFRIPRSGGNSVPTVLQTGVYQVAIRNAPADAEGIWQARQVAVSVKTRMGDVWNTTVYLGAPGAPFPVFDLLVSKDVNSGLYSVSTVE